MSQRVFPSLEVIQRSLPTFDMCVTNRENAFSNERNVHVISMNFFVLTVKNSENFTFIVICYVRFVFGIKFTFQLTDESNEFSSSDCLLFLADFALRNRLNLTASLLGDINVFLPSVIRFYK